ncbi:hypothetical protein J6590_037915 [Homalodisca vitripennis]|nr:hypothetical protein J6590_037915 [Homalodisca vitripennis]
MGARLCEEPAAHSPVDGAWGTRLVDAIRGIALPPKYVDNRDKRMLHFTFRFTPGIWSHVRFRPLRQRPFWISPESRFQKLSCETMDGALSTEMLVSEVYIPTPSPNQLTNNDAFDWHPTIQSQGGVRTTGIPVSAIVLHDSTRNPVGDTDTGEPISGDSVQVHVNGGREEGGTNKCLKYKIKNGSENKCPFYAILVIIKTRQTKLVMTEDSYGHSLVALIGELLLLTLSADHGRLESDNQTNRLVAD